MIAATPIMEANVKHIPIKVSQMKEWYPSFFVASRESELKEGGIL